MSINTVLHSGCDLPGVGDVLQCGEGIAIVLDALMSVAWQDPGKVWTVVSSRFVSARLQLCLGDSGCASNKLNVIYICWCLCTYSCCSIGSEGEIL